MLALTAALAPTNSALATTATTAGPAGPSAAQVTALHDSLRAGTLSRTQGLDKICADHHLACQAQVVTASRNSRQALATHPDALQPQIGYSPAELAKAYGLKGAARGSGTIVVIGAGAYPTLDSDLSIYRSTFGLPACTLADGCLRQVSYLGGAPYSPSTDLDDQFGEEDLAVETALDVDMASAACPACSIVSMQVPLHDGFFGSLKDTHRAILHFATGVQTAHTLGASAVSISYGYPTDSYSDRGVIPAKMRQPGMAVVSSSGDSGFLEDFGQWPQSLPTVTSAGGTSLYADKSTSRGFTETAWEGAGSGCTPDVPPAVGQPKYISRYCDGSRTASDVSADADPYTGPAIYDSYAPATGEPLGFLVVGGTSVSSPYLAGMYARAGVSPSLLGPSSVYGDPPSAFHDVTIGTNEGIGYCQSQLFYSNTLCDAGPGWDGPTGRGSPVGLSTFAG